METAVFRDQLAGGGSLRTITAGHEYRQDDLPTIAAWPDGSIWVTWLSFVGERDDVAHRHFYYVRLLQEHGIIAWPSPMFVNYFAKSVPEAKRLTDLKLPIDF